MKATKSSISVALILRQFISVKCSYTECGYIREHADAFNTRVILHTAGD